MKCFSLETSRRTHADLCAAQKHRVTIGGAPWMLWQTLCLAGVRWLHSENVA
jgi:hypothetical protein